MTPTPLGGEPNVFDYAHYSYLVDGSDRTELILLRHGQQRAHAPAGPFAAAIDPPLSQVGEQQVKLLGERFAEQDIDAVYSSRLLRAHATAEAVAGEHGLTPIVVDDLREVEVFRDLPPGATVLDVLGDVSMHGVRERMLFEKRWDVYPASESSADFRRRVVNAIEGIAALNTGRRVVVACHGGVINAYLAHHLGIHADMWFRPQHTSLNVMFAAANGIRAVRTIGDVHHLRDHAELVTF